MYTLKYMKVYPQPAKMCQGWFFIIVIIFFSLSYNIVRFFELRVEVTPELACKKILTDNFQEVEGFFSHIPYAEDFLNQDEKVRICVAKS